MKLKKPRLMMMLVVMKIRVEGELVLVVGVLDQEGIKLVELKKKDRLLV